MIGQPSVNDLASMFRGNPGPLQARVNQDMQGQPPGSLPKDLSDLLALQIVTNEQDAAKRNAAMQQLQQMQAQAPQGPQGEPPTIAQSLQEQAKQKLQARMMQQAMQSQQGIQGLPQIPQPEQQPQAEPQGLDMLPSNVGENYAGGGIIAFSGKDNNQEVPEARDERKVYPGMLPMEGGTVLPERSGMEGMTIGDIVALIRDKARRYFSPEREAENAAAMYASQRPPVDQSMANARDALLARGNVEAPSAPPAAPAAVPAAPARPPVRAGLPAALAQPAAPTPPAAPIQSDREKFLAQQFAPKSEGEVAAAAEQDFATKVGQRPTADLAALADELAARRQAIRERADPLMDFLRGVAAAPRGEKWMQSGVRGSAYADEQRAAREAQDMELLQKLMETKGKITDIEYGYKKEKYGVGKDAAAKAYDRTFKAAELMGYDEREAKKIAATAAENVLDRANRLEAARIAAGPRMAGLESRDIQLAEAAFARDPEAAAIRKRLEVPFGSEAKRAADLRRLREIQASKYAQFGIKLEGAPSAPSPGGNRPPLSSFQR